MGRRRAAVMVLLAMVLMGTACSGSGTSSSGGVVDEADAPPVGPQTFTVDVDMPSPEGQNLHAAIFFPLKVKVRPGDTVVFENRSTQVPHTVTFGLDAEGAVPPNPVTPDGRANPLVFEPCFSAAVPPAGSVACPDPAPAAPPAYAGTGFWSSGALAPAGAPEGESRSVALTIGPEAPIGVYTYNCELHTDMAGLLEVVELDEDRDNPAEVVRSGKGQRAGVMASLTRITEPPLPAVGPTVVSGWGTKLVSVNRFTPEVTTVKVGQKVTWQTAHASEPHTVTFESPFRTPQDDGVFVPGGAAAGARYGGGFAHSGLIGPAPFPSNAFSLVFTEPGTYPYVCVLHPGMAGQVVVTG